MAARTTTRKSTPAKGASSGSKTANAADSRSRTPRGRFTVPGLELEEGHKLAETLQMRLHGLNDLMLTLKHVHWNVVGPKFIGVHKMLDQQIEGVRAMVDELAERMAMLGVAPIGTPGALVAARDWDDYSLLRAQASEHLGALDIVYTGIIEDHRQVMEDSEPVDPVTQDLIIGQIAQLELYQWYIRAHLEDDGGVVASVGSHTLEEGAAAGLAADSSSD